MKCLACDKDKGRCVLKVVMSLKCSWYEGDVLAS